MNKIEIEGELDSGWILSLFAEGLNTYDIVSNYKLSEEAILECTDLLDKSVLIEGLNFSQDFIMKAIEIEYFTKEDIKDLSMTTYSNFTPEFILENKEFINWNRMIILISSQSEKFDDYIDVIQENNLWNYISANDLDIDFIRKWKNKLDWTYLSMIKKFTDEEKEEFKDYIKENEQKEIEDLDFTEYIDISDIDLETMIEEIRSSSTDEKNIL